MALSLYSHVYFKLKKKKRKSSASISCLFVIQSLSDMTFAAYLIISDIFYCDIVFKLGNNTNKYTDDESQIWWLNRWLTVALNTELTGV